MWCIYLRDIPVNEDNSVCSALVNKLLTFGVVGKNVLCYIIQHINCQVDDVLKLRSIPGNNDQYNNKTDFCYMCYMCVHSLVIWPCPQATPSFSMMHTGFSECIIEKLGVAWGWGYLWSTQTLSILLSTHNTFKNWTWIKVSPIIKPILYLYSRGIPAQLCTRAIDVYYSHKN